MAITSAGDTRGGVYTEVGFYACKPVAMGGGIRREQAGEVIEAVWLLLEEFRPAREIALARLIGGGVEVGLFRLSFRVVRGGRGRGRERG